MAERRRRAEGRGAANGMTRDDEGWVGGKAGLGARGRAEGWAHGHRMFRVFRMIAWCLMGNGGMGWHGFLSSVG